MTGEVTNLIEAIITWQGEKPDSGKRLLLLRFKRCNRVCRFCDTQVKMRTCIPFNIPLQEIQDIVLEEDCGILITGGEPTYSLNYSNTLQLTKLDSLFFNIETNGLQLEKLTNDTNKENIKFVLSPKLFSEVDIDFYFNLINNIKDDKRVFIKLVYEGTEYNDKFLEYLISSNFDNSHVFLMPEGKTKNELINNSPIVFDAAEKYRVNFSSRDHIIYNFI